MFFTNSCFAHFLPGFIGVSLPGHCFADFFLGFLAQSLPIIRTLLASPPIHMILLTCHCFAHFLLAFLAMFAIATTFLKIVPIGSNGP
ncbi:hypothetical protein MT325_m503R [Paramecium bursaria chlorella virus MT325]|uniref:Uncharacterized protein m503R n=1 Tax=Paramecium bursaria Chlorella virus MT325 TaxID=346932 RepID=A7IUN3_PBCVM|nr:hypothetical protein MT325_m503R [Paramecium bursaria chlorella virus MT325]